MASRSLPDPLSNLTPQPPETHPKSHPQETPLLQHGSDPPILPIHAFHEAFPMRNLSQQQFLQGDKNLQQAGELLKHISLCEGKEAEHQRDNQTNDQIVEEQDNLNQLIQERSDPRHGIPVQKARLHICEQDDVCKEALVTQEATTNKHLDELNLAEIMQSLQIAIPEEIEVGYQGEETQKSEESSPFQLLMKVASSGGTPRNIPLQPLNEAMSKAWGNNYWIIDQVKHATYKAYFRDEIAMDFVLQRQPWSLEGDNFLLEWINPRNADKNPDDYSFNYIYVPIRVYGVPQRYRTPHLMQYVIDKVAQPSDIHPPPDIKMVIRDDYMSAYAKMDVRIPVKDKVKYYVSPNEYILFYLHYDRVKRICTFCGLMFHTVQFCPNRRKLIQHLQSIGANTASVPFSYVGIWTSQATKIPQEAFEQTKVLGGLTSQFRQAMKVDKAALTTSQPLSRFTISDSGSGQKNLLVKKNCEFLNLIEEEGTRFASLQAPTQAQLKQKSLLGPPPRITYRNDTSTLAEPDVVGTFNHHNTSGPPHAPAKHSKLLNLSTCATYKRHQPSESPLSQHRLKRQATADPIREGLQEDQKEEAFVGFTSLQPSSPKYSGVASSQAHSSSNQYVYDPLQVHYGHEPESYVGNNFRSQITQAAHQIEGNAIKFTPGRDTLYAGEIRIIRPKSHSRWDRRKGSKNHNASVTKVAADVLGSHGTEVVPQAHRTSSNLLVSHNAFSPMVNHIQPMNQITSSPANIQSTQNQEVLTPWLENTAGLTKGAVSQDDHHWSIQTANMHPEAQLKGNAKDNIVAIIGDATMSISGNEGRAKDNNEAYIAEEMGENLQEDTDQAAALASKTPRMQFEAGAPAFKAPRAQ